MSTDLLKLLQEDKERVAKLSPVEQEIEKVTARLRLVNMQLERTEIECKRAAARQKELDKLPFDHRPYGILDCYENRSRLKSQKKRLRTRLKDLCNELRNL